MAYAGEVGFGEGSSNPDVIEQVEDEGSNELSPSNLEDTEHPEDEGRSALSSSDPNDIEQVEDEGSNKQSSSNPNDIEQVEDEGSNKQSPSNLVDIEHPEDERRSALSPSNLEDTEHPDDEERSVQSPSNLEDTEHPDDEERSVQSLIIPCAYKIVLQKNVFEHNLKKLEERASRTKDNQVPQSNENVCITKTFICHCPKDLQHNIAGIRIIGTHPPAVDVPMHSKPNNMYMADLQLPANDQFKYSYEVTRTSFLGLKKDTNRFQYYTINKNDGIVIRDMLTTNKGNVIESIVAHLYDVIVQAQIKSSYEDLLLWPIRFRSCLSSSMEVTKCAKLLLSVADYDEESTIRLTLVLYHLSLTHSVRLEEIITPAFANKCTVYLSHKKLSDFPRDYHLFVSEVCRCLYDIGYSVSACSFDFIDKFWSFFEERDLFELLKNELKSMKSFINTKSHTKLIERCKELMKKPVEENDVSTEMLKIFIQQCPEILLDLVSEVKQNKILSTQEKFLIEIYKDTQSKLREAIQQAKHNKCLIDLLKTATKAVAYDDNYGMKNEYEETILYLFSRSENVNMDDLLSATVDCLKYSSCFETRIGQMNLITSLVESKSRDIHSLLPLLLIEEKLVDIFMNLKSADFETWFDKEFGEPSSHSRDEIVRKVKRMAPLLKSKIVKQRKEVLTALKEAFFQWISWFPDRVEVAKSIPKVDTLGENESVLSFFKTTVQQYICQPGRKPYDVLLLFCKNNRELVVDDKTTAEVLSSIICMFFEEESNKSMSEVFMYLTKHEAFWDILKKRTGTCSDIISETKAYQCIEEKLAQFAEHFKCSDLSLTLYNFVDEHRGNSKSLLTLLGITQSEFEKKMKEYQEFMADTKNRLDAVQSIVKIVRDRKIPNKPDMNCIISSVSEITETFNVGRVSMNECTSLNCLWTDLQPVASECFSLHTLVKSEVFWNASIDTVLAKYAENYSSLVEDRCEGDQECDIIEDKQNAIDFLMVLMRTGKPLYSKFWNDMDTNPEMKMADVIKMFDNSVVPDEINLASDILSTPNASKTTDVLLKIWDTENVKRATYAIESVIGVLNYNVQDFAALKEYINAFRKLTARNVDHYTMREINEMLTNIFTLTKSLSSLTIDIMEGIGESSQLIEFLKSISIEEIKNLIDAVEYISESHVQESTVSALIEIKRFLDPLLNPKIDEIKIQWVFDVIENQTVSMEDKAKTLPGKLCDCRDNLHNLKSLYNGVANRGQQTKEVIKDVVSKGEFVFTFKSENEDLTFSAQYEKNKVKHEKNESVLLDMRSRALLLSNSDRHASENSFNTEEFKQFILAIDSCIEIRDNLSLLFSTGCNNQTHVGEKLPVKSLQCKKDIVTTELDSWTTRFKSIRKKYYLMNFITGAQIRTLCSFFDTGDSEAEVSSILKFIHPQLSINYLLIDSEETDQIERISEAVHKAYENLSFYYRDMGCTDCNRKLVKERVQNGRIFVAQLEENSKYVLQTVFALYHNTTHHFPEPNQIIICSSCTEWQELELLLNRCQYASNFYRDVPLYCLANVEKLQNEVQFKLVEKLQVLKTESKFLLAIVCRGSKNHPFVDRLSQNVSVVQPMTDVSFRNLLQSKFHHVQSYTSEVAGLGKTSRIFADGSRKCLCPKTIHISGTLQTKSIVESLVSMKLRSFHFLHIDIGMIDDLDGLNAFLFELIVLKYCSAGKKVFYLLTENVSLEIANSILNTLSNSLQIATSFSRLHLKWDNFDDFICSMETDSPVQVVCRYLQAIDRKQIDLMDIQYSKDSHYSPLLTSKCRKLLRKHMAATSDISYAIVNIFLNVLADQLKKFSCSSFFKVRRIADMIERNVVPTIRSNMVNSIIEVSRDFATRSVNACRTEQDPTVSYAEIVEASTNDDIKEAAKRTSSMIRWEESNHLIFVFHNQNIQTLSAMYREKDKLPEHIYKMFETQMNKPLPNFKEMKQTQLRELLSRVACHRTTPFTEKQLTEMSKDYAITPDNLLKMVLIMMRVLSGVPVVVMGETGCGKTSLIRYLAKVCEVQFHVFNIHAGTNPADVIEVIKTCDGWCSKNPDKPYWLFLDEINTSETVGLICSFICHHKCSGFETMPNLIIMGACNPYKLRAEEAMKSVGLTGRIKSDDLSKLVYRVLPLPEMMIDYVWDFGSLSEEDEQLYIEKMLEGVLSIKPHLNELLCKMLSASQKFLRETDTSTCVVSLRDVHRCKTLVEWFDEVLERKKVKSKVDVDKSTRAIILALAICYHSRFMDKKVRTRYIEELSKTPQSPNAEHIHEIIKEEQTDILDRMELPQGIAKNSALKENIFVILVCILNRIPVFLVGKPGCSKSLAMQVIRSNLRGKDSKNEFFKLLPQLYCVSFQGSESSTSDGIKHVFEKAEKYQTHNSKDDVLSVVVLDEIGLSEISRFNPLKVLHSLLEPEGRSHPNVAVVGISNWALDASKMNRAIHLSRPDMDEDELVETAISITHSFNETVKHEQRGLKMTSDTFKDNIHKIDEDLRLIAQSYIQYTQQLPHEHFHGLRDFYSLVKFVARNVAQVNDHELTADKKTSIIVEGLQRNFGGLQHGQRDILKHFQRCLNVDQYSLKSCNALVGENINDVLARHLMVITKDESVMDMIQATIGKFGRQRTEIIVGSKFEEDLTDDYIYRILSKIILCMEQGLVLILKDLDYIYGSLYDMLNQNYTRIGNKNNCRVALGSHSYPFCHVDESFRCIVIVQKDSLDHSDPPFLSRFEKQYMTLSDTLNNDQKQIADTLFDWVKCLTVIDGMVFSEFTAFPYFNDELIWSLIIYHDNLMKSSSKSVIDRCKHDLLWLLRPEVIFRLERVCDQNIVQSRSDIIDEYFALPIHNGIGDFIHKDNARTDKITIIFTSSNIHTDISHELVDQKYVSFKIGAFKSEKRLSTSLKQFWEDDKKEILIVHCNAAEDGKHLMLTKYLIEKPGVDIYDGQIKRVYIIVHMNMRDLSENTELNIISQSMAYISQINFLSGCQLVLLDSLESPNLPFLYKKNLFEVTEWYVQDTNNLRNALLWTFTRIKYGEKGRNADSVNDMLSKMRDCEPFLNVLAKCIPRQLRLVLPYSSDENLKWIVFVACDAHALINCLSLVNALEEHIKSVVKALLAKVIFGMERIGILDCFFVIDDDVIGRRLLWEDLLTDKKLFCVDKIPDPTGPECYFCDSPDISLKMPFSRIIFDEIERTKAMFLLCVATAKQKCELEPDDELPDEVLTGVMKYYEELYLEPVIPVVFSSESFKKYPSLCDDYISDFCNMFSDSILSHLNCHSRTVFTKWLFVRTIKSCEKTFERIVSHFHSTGWLHHSTFCSALQLLELYSDIIDKNFLATSPVNIHSTLAIDNVENDKDEENYADNTTQDSEYKTKGESALNDEDEIIFTRVPNVPANTKAVKLSLNSESLESFVSAICKQILSRFADDSAWHFTKNFVTIAREVSDEAILKKLRLCDDIATYFIHIHSLELSELKPLVQILEHTDVDSDEVFMEIKRILNLIDHQQSNTTKSRTMCQYLFRCLSSNFESASKFLFQSIVDNIIPEQEYGLLKEILFNLIESLDENIITTISSYDCHQHYIEGNSFLKQLNGDLTHLKEKHGYGHQFIMLVVDTTQELIQLPDDDDSFNDLIYKSGMIIRDNSCPLSFLTALAFLRSTVSKLCNRINGDTGSCISQLTTLNGAMNGLADSPICNSLKLYFLKILGQTSPIHIIQTTCNSLAKVFPGITELQWSPQFWSKAVEYNAMAMHIDIEALKKGELLACQADNFEKNMNDLKTVIEAIGDEGKLLVFSLALSEYYTKGYRSKLDDDVKQKAEIFYEVAQDFMKSECEKKMLSFLTGREDFRNDCFHLHEKTSFQEYMITLSLVSLYCLLLPKWNECQTSTSLLLKCLICPSEVKFLYKPCNTVHIQNLLDKYASFDGKAYFIVCSCNNRLLLRHNETLLCPICGKVYECNTKVTEKPSNLESSFSRCPYSYSLSCIQRKYFFGNMSALSYHVYQFMVKGALLGSLQLDSANNQPVAKLLSVSEQDLNEPLYSEVKDHWINIGFFTNLNDYELGQLVQRLFMSSIEVLFDDSFDFENVDATLKWEQSFDKRISALVKDNIRNLHQHQRLYEEVYQFPKPNLESQVRELDCIDENSHEMRSLLSIFRMTAKPSRYTFMQVLITNQQNYPWLMRVMLFEEDLKLPNHLCNLMYWHTTTCIKISYSFNRWECTDMSVREFIEKQSKSIHVQNIFNAFKSSVATLRKKKLGDEWCIEIPDINEKTKIEECLMTDKESWLYKLVTKLVDIQNDFIDFSLMLSFESKNLLFLLRDENSAYKKSVSINELKPEHLITMDLNNDGVDNLLAVNSYAELAYGYGHVINHDLQSIEKDLVNNLICDGQKSYITLSGLQLFVFKDELYRSFVSLLNDVKQRVPQEPLPVDLLKQIENANSERPNMASEFINNLDIILTLLKHAKCQPDTPLNEYVQPFKHMIGQDFSLNFLSSLESSLKVCHVVSLHELLEELRVDRIIGCLEGKYTEELSENVKEHFRILTTGNIQRSEAIVKALKRFTYRCIYMCPTSPDGALHEFMVSPSFWTESSLIENKLQIDGKTEELLEIFPSEVKVCHVVNIVLQINEIIETQRKSDVRLDSVITSYTQKNPLVKPSQQKKLAKKLKKK